MSVDRSEEDGDKAQQQPEPRPQAGTRPPQHQERQPGIGLSVIGVYPQTARTFPIGMAMNKNLTVKMGNCNHRRYAPILVDMVRSGAVDPAAVLTQLEPLTEAIDA